MTRDEAIKNITMWMYATSDLPPKQVAEALDLAIAVLRQDEDTALRPVSREQVEKVFPGCPACKNGSPKIHIPAFRAMAVCNQHMDHEAFDIELNSKFCLNCGRPMTDEAVDMVMERLEELHENR